MLWSVGQGPDGVAAVTRSDDAGSTWVAVASRLPGELRGPIDLHVGRSSEGEPTAWVAMAGIDSAATPGPEIWRRPLERDAGWEQIPGILQTRFLGFDPLGAWLAARAGRVELLRNSAGEELAAVSAG